jgi:CMP-N-acetylneuraminic acid synthetase
MYKGHSILGVIPARGGSKRVPRKNIKDLCGKPLIAWTIEEMKKSRYIDRLIISTEDEEIAGVARMWGGEVPFMRPKELAQDNSTDLELFTHALMWLKENEDYVPDICLRLPPTSPLRRVRDVDIGIEKLVDTPEADGLRPMALPDRHPYRMFKVSKEDERFIEPFLSEEVTGMRNAPSIPQQNYPLVYAQTGAFDAFRTSTVFEQRSTVGKKLAYILMSLEDSVNIDLPTDFFMAEVYMKKRLEAERNGAK